MTPANDALVAQLGKLLPMLSSDQDGEVLATVRAIGRKLEASHRDWHWLAGKVSGRATTATKPPPRPAPAKTSKAPGAAWTSLTRLQQGQWLSKLESLRGLPESDQSFIRALRRDFRDGRDVLWVPSAKKRIFRLVQDARRSGHEIWS